MACPRGTGLIFRDMNPKRDECKTRIEEGHLMLVEPKHVEAKTVSALVKYYTSRVNNEIQNH